MGPHLCYFMYSIRSQQRTCFHSLVDAQSYVNRAPLPSFGIRLVLLLVPFFPWPRLRLQSRMAHHRPPSTTYNAQKYFYWVNGGLFSPLLSPHSPSTLRRAGAGRPPYSRSYSTTCPRNKPSISNPRQKRPNTATSTSDNPPFLDPFLLTRPSTVIPLEIWDCPGNTTPESLGASLADFSSIIFVIDIQVACSYLIRCTAFAPLSCSNPPLQDSYQQPIARMLDFFAAAYQENPGATLEVFVHKAESLAEDYKIGTWSCDTQFTSAVLSARVEMGLTPAPPLDFFA